MRRGGNPSQLSISAAGETFEFGPVAPLVKFSDIYRVGYSEFESSKLFLDCHTKS